MSSLPSIVSILKDRGYEALALHPFDETFYNRNRVYPVLGFDRFTSEKDLPDADRLTPGGMSRIKRLYRRQSGSFKRLRARHSCIW